MKKLISIVFGTRPELIKLAPVILLAQQDARFNVEVIFTGQQKSRWPSRLCAGP